MANFLAGLLGINQGKKNNVLANKFFYQRQEPELRTQYPYAYGLLGAMAGTAPDEMGGSVLDPQTAQVRAGAKVGYPIGVGAQMLPAYGATMKVLGAPEKAGMLAEALMQRTGMQLNAAPKAKSAGLGFDPVKMRTQYPDIAPPVLAVDKKSGKEFLQKQNSAEAEAVAKVRQQAQKDIDSGNFTPYFNPEERFYADPNNYPLTGSTLTDALPKKQATIDKWVKQFDTPEVRQRLLDAYNAAAGDKNAHDWYATGQLEKAFIDQFGPEIGRQKYREMFADAMAATTGGADPTSNLLMAQYGNYLKQQGLPIPAASYEYPYPIGGRYASGNMQMFDKVINNGNDLTASGQPKRFNFSSNFMGHRGNATIDEQMSGLYDPALKAPPGDSYGVMQGILNDVAQGIGVQPVNFQDVAWAGAKGVPGNPMINHVNNAIYRTAKVTGQSQEDALRQIINGGPMYGAAPAIPLGLLNYDDQNK